MISIIAIFLSIVNAADVMEVSQYNNSMLWGTYRPNLYFGTKIRHPNSLLTGLIWFGLDLKTNPMENIRHGCDQGDGLVYAWQKHNGRNYGKQTITDKLNNIIITTEYVKIENGVYGGDWTVRVQARPLDVDRPADVSLIHYIGFDHDNGILRNQETDQDDVHLTGESAELGRFSLFVRDQGNQRPVAIQSPQIPNIDGINTISISIPGQDVWKIKDILQSKILNTARKRSNIPGITPAGLFALEEESASSVENKVFVTQHMLKAPFELDISFVSHSNQAAQKQLSQKSISDQLAFEEINYDTYFEKRFGLQKYYDQQEVEFGKMMISNMLGGIGYFHGSHIVDSSRLEFDETAITDNPDDGENDYFENESIIIPDPNPQSVGPFSLFTGVPSRPFFPRGFLWDSGFDSFLIGAYDNELSMDIISSWANLIDDDGWVAREQILGAEARSKVPPQFQIQYPHFANPTILAGALIKIVKNIQNPVIFESGSQSTVQSQITFLRKVYPKFKRQYEWFKESQAGQIEEWGYGVDIKYGFKWRGRHESHLLTSGINLLNLVAHAGDLHLDLHCWVMYLAKALIEVATELNIAKDLDSFKSDYRSMNQTLHALHWDKKSRSFTDISLNDNGKIIHVVHKGYVSILPLILELIPVNSAKVGDMLDLIHDPLQLWSSFGICSLSKADMFYGQNENYWRGPIWMNINYLVLQSLHNTYSKSGPHSVKAGLMYKELRANLIDNVYSKYVETGFVWEQYSCDDGAGARSHPFTGWTSLVLLIMAEKY